MNYTIVKINNFNFKASEFTNLLLANKIDFELVNILTGWSFRRYFKENRRVKN